MASKNSRKPRLPLAMQAARLLFPRFEFILPSLARRWFVNLFFAPPRYPIPMHEREILRQAKTFAININEYTVNGYEWGSGPTILMVHGWAGRASQFKDFVAHFVAKGYRVVSFDAVGHGTSEGKETTIIDFKNVILKIEEKFGTLNGILGHSLGGAAAIYAIADGLKVNKLITISTPTIGDEIIHEFAMRLNASAKAQQFLKAAIMKRLNRTFDEFMALHHVKRITHNIDFLIIHDEHDKEASLHNAVKLNEHYPSSIFHKTSGLGHVRILKNKEVMELCHSFLDGKIDIHKVPITSVNTEATNMLL